MRALTGYTKTAGTTTSWVCSLLVVLTAIGAASLALASFTLTSTRDAGAAEGFEYGLRIGHAFNLTDAQLNAQLDKAVGAHATTVQVMASWRALAPNTPREYDWAYLDRTVAAAEARGLEVHLQLEKTPAWMNATDTYPPTTATELQQWRDFCFDIAGRYGTRVARYEVWNEPNLQSFWSTGPDPVKWAALLRSGYLGLKDANPNVTVTSGGISLNDLGFLRQTYAAIKAYPDAAANNNFFDELGLHPYSSYGPLPQIPIPPDQTLAAARWTSRWGPASANFTDFAWMRNEMVAQGDGAKEIYIGEYGFSTTQTWMQAVPDATRADYLKRAYTVARNTDYISGLSWFSYVEEPPWATVDPNLNESLTFQAFREVASEAPPPPADNTPPETTIDAGPSGIVGSYSATFGFSSSEAGSTFECSLDGVAFTPCATPKSYANLSEGSHAFEVRATDAAGNTDATPARLTWTVDTDVPVPSPITLNVAIASDTDIVESTPKANYGDIASLTSDGDEPTGSGQDAYALLRFDLSGVPAGSTVDSARLVLDVTDTTSQAYEAYALEKAWVEKQASWRWSRSGSWWEVSGARGATDRSPQSLANLTPDALGRQAFGLNTSGVARVQGWIDGTVANNGLILAGSSNTDGFDFSSGESLDASPRPVLRITYTPAR
jgi:hypothetical protein